jgi:hypothetical protein
MPGCNILGPINVYERSAAAITELAKCLRMHDTKGCENSQNMSYYANLAPLKAPVPPLHATDSSRGHLAAMSLMFWLEMSVFDQGGPGFEFR